MLLVFKTSSMKRACFWRFLLNDYPMPLNEHPHENFLCTPLCGVNTHRLYETLTSCLLQRLPNYALHARKFKCSHNQVNHYVIYVRTFDVLFRNNGCVQRCASSRNFLSDHFKGMMLFTIGVGAGKCLGARRIFIRIFPNLPEKCLCAFCPQILSPTKIMKTFLWCDLKQLLWILNFEIQQDSAFSSPNPAPKPPPPEWPSQQEPGSGLTASAPVSDVSAPACTTGVWPLLWVVSVAQKNKPWTMLSSSVQSIDLPTDCMAWRFWTMRRPNGCSTSALRSSAGKLRFEQLAQKKKTWNKGLNVFFCNHWSPFLLRFSGILSGFLEVLPTFSEILPRFSTNLNFWGCACTPASYNSAFYKSSSFLHYFTLVHDDDRLQQLLVRCFGVRVS